MYTIQQDIKNIQRLKTDAPTVYETYRVKRVSRIKEELADMRAGYKSLPPEEQRRLTLHADNLKTILTELEGNGDQKASDTPSETETL